MKKGRIEIIEESFTEIYGLKDCEGIVGLYTKKDLRDLKSLIDTVLGEEMQCLCKEYPCPYVKQKTPKEILGVDWKKEWDSQPLTEGEGEQKGVNLPGYELPKSCPNVKSHKNGVCFNKFHNKPQESNKEAEPSKKPSERIEELANEVELQSAGSLVDMVDAKCIGIAKYLDELHNQGKIVGCNECGNNINI